MSLSILIVEDDRDISDLLTTTLSYAGFSTYAARTMNEAVTFSKEKVPDAAIIDWMLPQGSGIQLIHYWRKNTTTAKLPILLLTAKQEEQDKLTAFEKGVDDYLTKPFSSKELVARLNALLRRSALHTKTSPSDQLQIGVLLLDLAKHQVLIKGQLVALYPAEFKLLHFFMTHSDRVYNRTQLLDHVWGIHTALEERTVDVHIRRLRKSLEPYHIEAAIETVRSVGYRLNSHALA